MILPGASAIFNWLSPIPDFENRIVRKCYWADAMIGYIECRDFDGTAVEGAFRGLFLIPVYLVALVPYSLVIVVPLIIVLWLAARFVKRKLAQAVSRSPLTLPARS
jgi:hypothetical protein